MKSIPQRKDQAQKAFHVNFIKYLRRNFYQNLPENRGKGIPHKSFYGQKYTKRHKKTTDHIISLTNRDTEILYKTSTK